MNLRWIAFGLAAPLLAQSPGPDLKRDPEWTVGVGLHMGFPSGELSSAVNDHTGYGFALQCPMVLGGGLVLVEDIERFLSIEEHEALQLALNLDS